MASLMLRDEADINLNRAKMGFLRHPSAHQQAALEVAGNARGEQGGHRR